MRRKSYLFSFLVLMPLFFAVHGELLASSRNLVPRLPEVVLLEGISSDYLVSKCTADVTITDTTAESAIKIEIANTSQKTLSASLKFRVLYPISDSKIKITVAGKPVPFKRADTKYDLNLEAQESVEILISAHTSINYSVDLVRKALIEEEEANKNSSNKKDNILSSFTRYFSKERFGKRFMVGAIVSKWGVFPLEFKNVQIKIALPSDFDIATLNPDDWKKETTSTNIIFSYESEENFAGAVFLPASDKEDFLKTQEILTSEKYMH